jgi:hypothetical protein
MQECSWQVRCILHIGTRSTVQAGTPGKGGSIPALEEVHLWAALQHGTESWSCLRTGVLALVQRSGAMWETQAVPWVADSLWRNRWTVAAWRDYLAASEAESDLAAIRRCTHTDRPLGNAALISKLEQTTGRRLRPQSKGRRNESTQDPRQASLSLDAPPV